ncbi:hypothetical protein GCM10018793_50980 [Streptomyces sulfonofaciens]|uniref:Bacterial bifunctional deaminase-reductase C-terminal domain-containing protein n=1 Tax=Streptomyces sulfonofaciens TaxID=68272 RepID=A0A919L677_9ACTN|nr:hypothetical protein GCM10018793_50980 [Streptomyces sulfonofaciens]
MTEETPGRTGRREAREPGEGATAPTAGAAPAAGDGARSGVRAAQEAEAAWGAGPSGSTGADERGLDWLAEAYAYPEPLGAGGTTQQGPAQDRGSARDREAEGSPAQDRPAQDQGPARDQGLAQGGGAARGTWWLRANMVAGLDGAGEHGGRSQPLSGPADMRVFGVLRSLADVVIVGAETVRREGYRPARARRAFAERRAAAGQAPAPAIAVVSAGLDLDFSRPLFTEPLVPTLVLTGEAAPADRVAAARAGGAQVVIAGSGAGVVPELVVRALAARGYRRMLLEGGPRLLGQFVAASVLDELCLTLSPVLTAGRAPRIAEGPDIAVPDRLELVSVLEEDGFLFTRYRRQVDAHGSSCAGARAIP